MPNTFSHKTLKSYKPIEIDKKTITKVQIKTKIFSYMKYTVISKI